MGDRTDGYRRERGGSRSRAPGGPRNRLDWRKLVTAFRRRTRLFFAVLAGTLCATIIITALRVPLYEARAEVVLGGETATEMAALRSRDMAARVAAALHLEGTSEFAAPHGPIQRLHDLLGQTNPPPDRPAVTADVIDRLRRNLAVTQPAGTLSLGISYTATDPVTAARIANAYAFSYTGGSADPGRRGISEGRIIAAADPPLTASSPQPLASLIVGVVLGSILGLAAAVLIELRFAGLTSGTDVRNRLWVQYLGSVPELASVLPNALSAADAVVDHRHSAFAEAFRSLLTAMQRTGGERPRVVAIASTLPGEGKTTVAICLARTLALSRESVVLVDCDPRGGVSDTLGVMGSAGLAELLDGSAALDDALVRDEPSGAFLLPITRSPATLPDLMAGSAMASLIEELRGRFRHVLIATGPLASADEARSVAAMADASVIVIRWRATADRVITAALTQLRDDKVPIAGAVLSRVDMRKQVRYSDDEATTYQRQFSKYYS